MNNQDKEHDFVDRCSSLLNHSVHSIDDDTKNALARLRKNAVAAVSETSPSIVTGYRFTTTQLFATTAVAVLVVALTLQLNFSQSVGVLPELDDMMLLTETDDLDLYRNLEFYHWLEDEYTQGGIDG